MKRSPQTTLEEAMDVSGTERSTASIDEERLAGVGAGHLGPDSTPLPHGVNAPGVQGDDPLLTPLTEYAQPPLVEVEVAHGQSAEFTHPQTRSVKNLAHRAVAPGPRVVLPRSVEQTFQIVASGEIGQTPLRAGCREAPGRRLGLATRLHPPVEVGPKGGAPSGESRRTVAVIEPVGEKLPQRRERDEVRRVEAPPVDQGDEISPVGPHRMGRTVPCPEGARELLEFPRGTNLVVRGHNRKGTETGTYVLDIAG